MKSQRSDLSEPSVARTYNALTALMQCIRLRSSKCLANGQHAAQQRDDHHKPHDKDKNPRVGTAD